MGVVVLASGCAASPPPEASATTAPGPVAPHEPQFTDDTGALVVQVLTEELEPIAGAEVGISGSDAGALVARLGAATLRGAAEPDMKTISNEVGEAYFERITPGSYVVYVQASNFTGAGRKADVRVGEVTTLSIALVRAPSTEPYSELIERTGTWKCEVGGPNLMTGDLCRDLVNDLGGVCGPNNCMRAKTADGWTAGVLEIVAPPQSALAANGIYAVLNVNWTGHANWVGVACVKQRQPLRFEFASNQTTDAAMKCGSQPPQLAPEGPLGVAIPIFPWSGSDYYIVVEQKWTGWLTVFYHQAAPKDYSAQPDG